MANLSLSRRSFLKASAMAAAATTVGFAATPSTALAEGEDASAGEIKRIRSCCRACGKVECGVWVTVQDNKVIKVEGDESNAHSRGHCCSKSQSSMMALYHPDRLRYCQKRTNPKGEEDPGWQRISLAEAFDEAGAKFNEIVDKYGGESVFTAGGTSRIYCMAPYASFKNLFNTPNSITAQQICKGPRHFATIMTDENAASWMEVEQQPLVYMQWGTAVEYSNYDSSCRGVVDIAQRAYKHILVDPRMTPLGKEADIWLPSSEKEVNLPALTGDSDYRDGLIGNTIAEMRQNPEKLDGVVRLTYEKYYDEFAGAIGIEESGIPLEEYTEAFKTALELSADEIETRIKQVASDYLRTIDIEPVEYEIGHIDLDDEVIDMLSDNLDPEGTPDAKNTLHIYGSVCR